MLEYLYRGRVDIGSASYTGEVLGRKRVAVFADVAAKTAIEGLGEYLRVWCWGPAGHRQHHGGGSAVLRQMIGGVFQPPGKECDAE